MTIIKTSNSNSIDEFAYNFSQKNFQFQLHKNNILMFWDYTLELQIWLDSKLVADAYEVGDFKILPTPFFASNQTFSTFPAHLLLRTEWEFKSK